MGGNQLLWTFFIIFSIASCQSAPADSGIPPLLSFKDGIFGVNFLGFHAAAGIGSNGRLHAEAGTPFGQRAAAGLNGAMNNGRLGGSLYAGATAGGNVKAAAGLGGEVIDGKTVGTLYSGASAGSVSAGSSLDGDSNTGYVRNKVVNGVLKQTISNRVPAQVEEIPIHVPVKEVHISNDTPKEYAPMKDIPKEAPVQEEAYPVPNNGPISNEVLHGDLTISNNKVTHIRGHPVKFDRFLNHQVNVEKTQTNKVEEVQTPIVITKRIQIEALPPPPPPPHHHHPLPPPPPPPPHHIEVGSAANFGSNFLQSFLSAGTSDIAVQRYPKSPASETTITTTVHKNPSFFEDIFNIPISTLGAVSKFLSNSVGSVQKSVSVQQTPHNLESHH